MKYCEAFCMRRHTEDTEKLQTNDATSWSFVCSTTVYKPMWLQSFVVGEAKDPFPEPRLDLLEVDGANGELDMTEVDGRLVYNRKEITVILSHKPTVYEPVVLNMVNERLRPWHGTLVDVAFNIPSEVQYYYTGRVIASEYDYDKERIILRINVQPFAKKANITSFFPPRSVRVTTGFEQVTATSGILSVSYPTTNQVKIFGSVGEKVKLKLKNLSEGVYTFGTSEARGGVWSIERDTATYPRLKQMSKKVVGSTDGSGNLNIVFTIDGSSYDWYTSNGVRKYVPCLYLSWECMKISTDSDTGNVKLIDVNASIRVTAKNEGNSNALLIVDGSVKSIPVSGINLEDNDFVGYELDGVWIPEKRAKSQIYDFSGVWVVFAYANGNNIGTDVEFSFREEVLHA